ncbi:MAG: hypothetical protein ABIL00_06850 [candidate division WOR-3 bacterium]
MGRRRVAEGGKGVLEKGEEKGGKELGKKVGEEWRERGGKRLGKRLGEELPLSTPQGGRRGD